MTTARDRRGLTQLDKARVPLAPPPIQASDEPQTLFSRQVRMAYGLLHNAIEEAADTVECQNAKLAAELEDLQGRALRSIRESALVTIELIEAMGAARSPGDIARSQLELAQRHRESANARLTDFFETAKSMVSVLADPLNRQMRLLTSATSLDRPSAPGEESILTRLNRLTARQKRVLELLAEGLPNKVIAHELGISETTVKAHVGEILRKLKVYNRARAIVVLGQCDLRQLRELPTEG